MTVRNDNYGNLNAIFNVFKTGSTSSILECVNTTSRSCIMSGLVGSGSYIIRVAGGGHGANPKVGFSKYGSLGT